MRRRRQWPVQQAFQRLGPMEQTGEFDLKAAGPSFVGHVARLP